jgi:hypothetical protein
MEANLDRTYDQLLDQRTNLIDDTKTYKFVPSYSTDSNKETNTRYGDDAVKGIYEKSLLSVAFFSKLNIQKIQNKIRYTIYKLSKEQTIISEQSEAELKIIMRSIFLQYSKNNETNIREQINLLNNIVVDNISEKLWSSTRQYLQYLKDVGQSYGGDQAFFQRPTNVNSAGSKVLRTDSSLGVGNSGDFINRNPFE